MASLIHKQPDSQLDGGLLGLHRMCLSKKEKPRAMLGC